MKPKSRKEAYFQEKYAKLDGFANVDPQFKRDEKRVWKKARTKHLRAESKESLRQLEQEFFDNRIEDEFWDQVAHEVHGGWEFLDANEE